MDGHGEAPIVAGDDVLERAEAAIVRTKFLAELNPSTRQRADVDQVREAMEEELRISSAKTASKPASLVESLSGVLSKVSPQALPHLRIAKPVQPRAVSDEDVSIVGPAVPSTFPAGGAGELPAISHSPGKVPRVATLIPARVTSSLASPRNALKSSPRSGDQHRAAAKRVETIMKACDASSHDALAELVSAQAGTPAPVPAPVPARKLVRNVLAKLQTASQSTSVAAALRQRNPKLMAALDRLKGEHKAGAAYRSMDLEEVKRRALGKPIAADAAMTVETREDKFLRTLALDAIADFSRHRKAAAGDEEEMPTTAHPPDGEPGQPNEPPTAPSTASRKTRPSATGVQSRVSSAISSPKPVSGLNHFYERHGGPTGSSSHALRPEDFLVLNGQNRVGGEFRRDVDVLRELIMCIDPDNLGTISFENLVATMIKGPSSFAHMRRHLEILFRSADKHGTGILSIAEFSKAIFPRAAADPKLLREIVGYLTYRGPPPEQLRAEYIKHNPEAMAMLRSLFDAYDTDGSGTIDFMELDTAFKAVRALYGSDASKPKDTEGDGIADFMTAMDQSGDGEVTFDEFVIAVGPYLLGID